MTLKDKGITEISLNGHLYKLLDDAAGIGGSSIIYMAERIGSQANKYWIIKEFYPAVKGIKVSRNENGYVVFSSCKQTGWDIEVLKENVKREQDTVAELRDVGNNDERFFPYEFQLPVEQNGTLYTVIGTAEGDMLSKIIADDGFKDFTEICKCMDEILCALKPIHDKGYLHLDIAPDNIHFSKLRTPGIARIIDYNSAWKQSESPEKRIPSYKKGYSAPELDPNDPVLPTTATDLFSVAAVFFRLLNGRTVERDDISQPHKWKRQLEENTYLKTHSNLLKKKTFSLIYKCLLPDMNKRIASVDLMREKLDELLEFSKKKSLCNTINLHTGYGYFTGREKEVEDIHAKLQTSNHLFLEGGHGVGKTEIAKRYADEKRKDYDIVQFISYDGNLKSTIASKLKFFNLNENDYFKDPEKRNSEVDEIWDEKIKCLAEHDERTLIIIDNYNDLPNEDFWELASGNYKVLLTMTKTKDTTHGQNTYPIKAFEHDVDLLRLFNKYCTKELKETDRATILEICCLLERNTYAITLAAAALSNSIDKTVDVLLEQLQRSFKEVRIKFAVNKEGVKTEDREGAFFQHILVLYDVSDIQRNHSLNTIMTNMALVYPDGIPLNNFCDWVMPGVDLDTAKSDINDLIKRRWIHYNDHTGNIFLLDLASAAVNEHLRPDSQKCEGLITGLIDFVSEYPGDDYNQLRENAKMIGFVSERIDDETALAIELHSSAGYAYDDSGNQIIAMTHIEKALGSSLRVYGEQHSRTAELLNQCGDNSLQFYTDTVALNLAKISRFSSSDEDEEALELQKNLMGGTYFMALVIYKSLYGSNHIEIAKSFDRIGRFYTRTEEYKAARQYLRKAIKLFKVLVKATGDISCTAGSHMAEAYIELGRTFLHTGRYCKGLRLWDKALKCAEKYEPENIEYIDFIRSLIKNQKDALNE